jgi:hypothetical protein
MGGVGAQRPVWHANDPKKTGARIARARTRGQNPLVLNIFEDFRRYSQLKDSRCTTDVNDMVANGQNLQAEKF